MPRYRQKTVCSQIGQLISVTVCAISKSDEISVRYCGMPRSKQTVIKVPRGLRLKKNVTARWAPGL